MNILTRIALPAVAFATLGLSAGEAHALGPVDVEVGAKIGFATKPAATPLTPTPFGIGVGGRAGVSIFHLYGGVSAVHYFGETQDVVSMLGTTKVSYSSTLLGVEAGYNITAIPLLTIRPQLGLGNAQFSLGDTSEGHLYLEPGVTALLSLGLLYVGADANLLAVPGIPQDDGTTKWFTAFSVHGQIGVKF